MLYPVFLMKALCFALFACAFNLLIGYVGLLSFGHALYFGWAGYLAAYAAKSWGLPPELAILIGTATAAMLGVVAGAIAIRRQGIYFAMITLALAQMMYLVALRVKLTGGEDGIQAVPRGHLFGTFDLNNEMTMYVFVLVVVLAAFFLIYRIINSPFGEVLKAIRENEQRAISLGYSTDRYKLIAFVLSARLAGLAGSLKTIVFQLASLTDVDWTMSGEVVLMTLRLIRAERQNAAHARVDGRMDHVTAAHDVRLNRLKRIVFTRRHLLERRRMHDCRDASERPFEPFRIAHVANEITQVGMVEAAGPHLMLLQFIAAQNHQFVRPVLAQHDLDKFFAKRPGAAGDQYRFLRPVDHLFVPCSFEIMARKSWCNGTTCNGATCNGTACNWDRSVVRRVLLLP